MFGYVTQNQNLLQDLKVWVWTLCMSCCTVCLALEATLCMFIHPLQLVPLHTSDAQVGDKIDYIKILDGLENLKEPST